MSAQQATGPHAGLIEEVFRSYAHEGAQTQQILAFLAKHPEVAEALLEALPLVEKVFGPGPLSVRLIEEPDDGSQELFGVIERDLEDDIWLDLLERFDYEWIGKTNPHLLSLLTFTVEFPEDVPV